MGPTLNIAQSESGVPYNVEILNSSDLSVHNGYECYWRVASDLSESESSESKTAIEVQRQKSHSFCFDEC